VDVEGLGFNPAGPLQTPEVLGDLLDERRFGGVCRIVAGD